MLRRGDDDALGAFFERAKQRRDQWSKRAPRGRRNRTAFREPPWPCRNSSRSSPRRSRCGPVTVPGSKSITNRALILAALAEGETTLRGALWSEDTQVMVECLQELGFMVNVAPDPGEPCNRTHHRVRQGRPGAPRRHRADSRVELFVGNAGTAARFLAALVCLGDGVIGFTACPGCTSGRRRRCSTRCASWAIASIPPTTGCRRHSRRRTAPGRLPGEHRGKLAVRLRPAAAAPASAAGRSRSRARTPRNRPTWR